MYRYMYMYIEIQSTPWLSNNPSAKCHLYNTYIYIHEYDTYLYIYICKYVGIDIFKYVRIDICIWIYKCIHSITFK
jgi:hypothetical protein